MLALLLTLAFSAPSLAASEQAVAVLYRPETVLVQINEKGVPNQLHAFLNWAGVGNSLSFTSRAGNLRIQCGRREDAASCTFRFYPGSGVRLFARGAEAELPGFTAGAEALNLRFTSSNGDSFELAGSGGVLRLKAAKR